MNSELAKAKRYLAMQMTNQVGVEWDECCNSVDIFCSRHIGNEQSLIDALYIEAYRYEDM